MWAVTFNSGVFRWIDKRRTNPTPPLTPCLRSTRLHPQGNTEWIGQGGKDIPTRVSSVPRASAPEGSRRTRAAPAEAARGPWGTDARGSASTPTTANTMSATRLRPAGPFASPVQSLEREVRVASLHVPAATPARRCGGCAWPVRCSHRSPTPVASRSRHSPP